MRYQTLSPISSTELLLVGGGGEYRKFISDEVKIFDSEKNEWRDQHPLPYEFVGRKGGLLEHRAVSSQNENGATVICLGGFVDHMAVFEYQF